MCIHLFCLDRPAAGRGSSGTIWLQVSDFKIELAGGNQVKAELKKNSVNQIIKGTNIFEEGDEVTEIGLVVTDSSAPATLRHTKGLT